MEQGELDFLTKDAIKESSPGDVFGTPGAHPLVPVSARAETDVPISVPCPGGGAPRAPATKPFTGKLHKKLAGTSHAPSNILHAARDLTSSGRHSPPAVAEEGDLNRDRWGDGADAEPLASSATPSMPSAPLKRKSPDVPEVGGQASPKRVSPAAGEADGDGDALGQGQGEAVRLNLAAEEMGADDVEDPQLQEAIRRSLQDRGDGDDQVRLGCSSPGIPRGKALSLLPGCVSGRGGGGRG
jgi:hypothetical protein